ncbi:MAG: alpha/beta hydrolase [Sneathiella sp.]|nr:alpha/beta hydrolase [Sneathiella sp.]
MSWQSMLLNLHVRRRFKAHDSEGSSVEVGRAALDSIFVVRKRLPSGLTVTPVSEKNMVGEWLHFSKDPEHKVCLYLHGGGYFWGSAKKYRELTIRIAKSFGGRVFAPDYRLAPEHPFPAAVDDALMAYSYLLDQGISAKSICVAGDSAGGGLSLSLLIALRERGLPMPAAASLISPWTDLTCSGESMGYNARKDPLFKPSMLMWNSRHYCGDRDKSDPRISPLFADLKGLPPLLLQVGSTEILLDDSRRVHEKISSHGGSSRLDIWPKMMHVWHLAAMFVPEGRRAIKEMGAFMNAHIN